MTKQKQIQYKTTDKLNSERIEAILNVKKEQKVLTAENLLESAKNKENPLHELFNWDDTEASNLWRLQQARCIINEVKIIIEDKEYYAFENVSVVVDDIDSEPMRVYLDKEEIENNESLRIQILKRAINNIEYWKEQYNSYGELKPIISSIEKVKKSLDKKWQQKVK